jgi:hypothetical protein
MDRGQGHYAGWHSREERCLSDSPVVTAARSVGRPIHEAKLVGALIDRVPEVFPPGRGRSLYILREPQLGRGRPDIIALLVSSAGLDAYQRRGLRLPHLTAALSLGPQTDDIGAGITNDYARKVQRRLGHLGWNEHKLRLASLVYDSMSIEAKMDDWRRAIRQASKFQPLTHRSALLLPEGVAQRASVTALEFYGLGVLSVSGTAIEWQREAPKRVPAIAARLWLLELLLRGIEDNSAYKASA